MRKVTAVKEHELDLQIGTPGPKIPILKPAKTKDKHLKQVKRGERGKNKERFSNRAN